MSACSRGLEQARQIGGLVREVGVHLDHQPRPAGEGMAEAGDVGGAEAFLALAVEEVNGLVPLGELGGDPPGAVGGVVVDDQDLGVGGKLVARIGDQPLDVRRLFVGGEDEPGRPSLGFARGHLRGRCY